MSCTEAVAPEVLCKKGVLRSFTKFTGKHLCQSLFFNKVAGLRPATLLKKRLWHKCFPVNFVKFLRTPFFKEHLWWLLLVVFVVLEKPNEGLTKLTSTRPINWGHNFTCAFHRDAKQRLRKIKVNVHV